MIGFSLPIDFCVGFTCFKDNIFQFLLTGSLFMLEKLGRNRWASMVPVNIPYAHCIHFRPQ